jgi:hypothetical protein
LTGFRRSKSFTLAQLGPRSRPVRGTRASSTPPAPTIFPVTLSRGTFSLRHPV